MVSLYVPILDYLSDLMEGVQERALRLIYPVTESCLEALQIANIARLKKSGDDICVKCRDKIESMDHPLHSLMTRTALAGCKENHFYSLLFRVAEASIY